MKLSYSIFVTIFVILSCATKYPQVRFDPSRKREVLNQDRPAFQVKAPSRKEISDLIVTPSVPAESSPNQDPSSVAQVKKTWTQEVSEIISGNSSNDEKVELVTRIIDVNFAQNNASIEAMAAELKQSAPEALEIFDYWLLGKLWDQQKYDEASRFASQLIHSSYEKIRLKAQYLFDQYYLNRKAAPQKIGVLIPSNNKQASRLQNALKLAFGNVEGSKSSYQLVFMDEPDDSEKYEQAFVNLVKSENVIAIIGGLRSKNRYEITRLSQKYRVPFIYVGQKSRVTDDSPYVFQYGLTNESQARVVALHAQSHGIKKFAIIYPNDGYGVEAANLFWDEWMALGGQITAAYTYHPQENDFQEIAAKLSNKFNLAARADEFKKLQKEKLEKDPQNKKRILSQSPVELLPAEYNFEAVYIPDVPRAMAKITAAMAYYGIRRLPVYGTRLWANQEAYKLAGSMWAAYLLIPESLYNQVANLGLQHPFFTDYQKYTGSLPEHIEVAVYEISLLLKGVLGAQGIDTREGLREALAQTASVTGVLNQPIYFDEFREIEGPIVMMRFNHLGQLIPVNTDMQ